MLPVRIFLRGIYRKALSVRLFGIYTANDLIENIQKKAILKSTGLMFEVHLVDHCNLNCKGCSHFSPVSDKKFVGVDAYEKDIKRLSEILTSKDVRRIRLLGGEPLLHPQVIDFIRLTHQYFPDAYVELVTNGLLLRNQSEDFWRSCKETKTRIIVTRYPIPIETPIIEELAHKYGVSLFIGPTHKYKTFKKLVFDLNGHQCGYLSHLFCFNYGYTCQLKDGKFYPCSIAAYFPNFSKHFELGIPEKQENFLDIYSEVSKNSFYEIMTKRIPQCRYCNIAAVKTNVKWDYSKRSISEWTTVKEK